MAGFETIVRPMVFPNIRPIPTRSLPPADDPEQGKCTIGGSGGGLIGVSESSSVNGTLQRQKERERRVDVARVHQKNDDGSINRENFVDIEVANRIKMTYGAPPPRPKDYVGFNGDDVVKTPGQSHGDNITEYRYDPIKEADNIEIKKKNKIKKAKLENA